MKKRWGSKFYGKQCKCGYNWWPWDPCCGNFEPESMSKFNIGEEVVVIEEAFFGNKNLMMSKFTYGKEVGYEHKLNCYTLNDKIISDKIYSVDEAQKIVNKFLTKKYF